MTDQPSLSCLRAEGEALARRGEELAAAVEELTVVGLELDQEIRARALDAAARTMASAAHPDPDRTLRLARQFSAWIERGDQPEGVTDR